MPILAPTEEIKIVTVKLKMSEDLLTEIKAYMEAYSITKLDDFFTKTTQHILESDNDWKKHKKDKNWHWKTYKTKT